MDNALFGAKAQDFLGQMPDKKWCLVRYSGTSGNAVLAGWHEGQEILRWLR